MYGDTVRYEITVSMLAENQGAFSDAAHALEKKIKYALSKKFVMGQDYNRRLAAIIDVQVKVKE
jgi:hypothetical protein